MVLPLTSCGEDDDGTTTAETSATSTAPRTLEDHVYELDRILRASIVEIGLDPEVARRELDDNSCIGPGGEGRNIEFYYDEPSHDRGVEYLRALEQAWNVGEFELNGPEPFQDDGSWASLLAVSGPYSLGADWFPASKELAIGGSTPCIDAEDASTTTPSTDPPTGDGSGSTSTTAP
ncbi:MAG: hypothetical protein EDR02_18635 [Actinobacteria bacterium]|nr:MAG: hypothetical protein EDR02_18635 [Actinomycetota bacterium]RIK02290.1 MAG: hypothetical protein DCC48_18365 [Acidobacteriota bacterium]